MTTTATTDENGRFTGDRYERMRQGAQILASDPNVQNGDFLMNGEALHAFVSTLEDERVLDGLTEHDANTVALLATFDFLKGPANMAGRIVSLLGSTLLGSTVVDRDDDNLWAVCAVLAEALQLYLLALAGDEFMEARTNTRWPNRGQGAE